MFCTECGKKITSGAEFCGYCGFPIPITPEQKEIRNSTQNNTKNLNPNETTKIWSDRDVAVGSIFCLWIYFGLCLVFPWLVFLAFVPLIAFLISGFMGGGDIDEPRGGHPGLFDGDE